MTMTGPPDMALPPNHHAHHPGFSGVGGLVAALGFNIGRRADAELAVRLTGVGHGDHVVDIGCGPGVAARRAAAAGATEVVGIDPAAVMLNVARLTPRRDDIEPRCAICAAQPNPCRSPTASPT